ncbi:hypothetical protein RJ641_020988 [Dillenia turbinata]|uniref:BHLH domain-containing protein n=1 Tax=Dillenia turbinata TaxID=194707 RepID=A0AAN8YUY3_9MAGN
MLVCKQLEMVGYVFVRNHVRACAIELEGHDSSNKQKPMDWDTLSKVTVQTLKDKEMCRSSNGATKGRVKGKHVIKCASRTRRKMLMKERGSRGSSNDIDRRIRTLKKLVPNGDSLDLNGLFRETADYIKCLEVSVKIMQFTVEVLSGPCI